MLELVQPVNLIEDCAVDVEDLPSYIDEVEALLKSHGLKYSMYAHAGAGERIVAAVGEDLGDAEVEQLGLAVAVDQDVGGLEVAMHHEAALREADGRQTFCISCRRSRTPSPRRRA